jgi:diguanylate cyclase
LSTDVTAGLTAELGGRAFWWVCGSVTLVVGVFIGLSSTGLLSRDSSQAVDDLGQFSAGSMATACCAWTAWRATRATRWPRQRRWRVWLLLGTAGWTGGQAIWSWYQIVADQEIPSPSLADVGYFALPLFALPALLAIPADRVPYGAALVGAPSSMIRRRTKILFILDALVIGGSLFVLAWSTTLGSAVRLGASNALEFSVAIAYPVSDLVLVVLVLLLAVFRRPHNSRALVLLSGGLLCLAFSDSLFTYVVSTGQPTMAPIYNVGFVVGPALIGLAVLVPEPGMPSGGPEQASSRAGWVTTLLPYLPLGAIGVMVLAQQLTGTRVDRVEIYGLIALVCTVVLRQMLTLLENLDLLRRVRESEERLRHQAFHDRLTGLPNRALFAERLDGAVDRHRAHAEPLALFFCDVDDLKPVNDGLGHAVGDTLLRIVAERLARCVRTGDTVARLGGDEFGVILVGYRDDPEAVGHRMLAELAAPVLLAGQTYQPAASMGVTIGDPADATLTATVLLNRADAAMYTAKRAGKGRLARFRPGMESSHGLQGLTPALRQTLAASRSEVSVVGSHKPADGLVRVVYQPIVRLSDRSVVAIEALARWSHPTRGTIAPKRLVAAAEYGGMLFTLEALILDMACRDVRQVRSRGRSDLAVHVNVSSATLGDPRLPGTINASLARYGLPGSALVLEITETSRVDDISSVVRVVTAVRQVGVQLALDGLGAGYDSLNYLLRLPIDIIKLDRSLGAAGADLAKVEAIGASAVHLARRLGMQLVAEGLESDEHLDRLVDLGCDLGQGHLLAPPVPLDRLVVTGPVRAAAR